MLFNQNKLYNNLYVNRVQAASCSSMNLISCFIWVQRPVSHWGTRPRPWMPVQRATLRVLAVISLAIALVSQAVSFRTQPAELELTMPSVTRWVCMGCQQPNRLGVPGPGYFADYKSAASSTACNKSKRGSCTVTIVSRQSNRDAGGGGAVA